MQHISPQTQNEVIEILGKDIVPIDILTKSEGSKVLHSISRRGNSTVHLALCVRFVDAECNIREEFLSFNPLLRISGEYLAKTILSSLDNLGLGARNIRGQGYDGASNMSSHKVGVQAKIEDVVPLATYVHCSRHCLNLVIVHSCSLPEVINVLDRLKHCCRYSLFSPKISGLLAFVFIVEALKVIRYCRHTYMLTRFLR